MLREWLEILLSLLVLTCLTAFAGTSMIQNPIYRRAQCDGFRQPPDPATDDVDSVISRKISKAGKVVGRSLTSPLLN